MCFFFFFLFVGVYDAAILISELEEGLGSSAGYWVFFPTARHQTTC